MRELTAALKEILCGFREGEKSRDHIVWTTLSLLKSTFIKDAPKSSHPVPAFLRSRDNVLLGSYPTEEKAYLPDGH